MIERLGWEFCWSLRIFGTVPQKTRMVRCMVSGFFQLGDETNVSSWECESIYSLLFCFPSFCFHFPLSSITTHCPSNTKYTRDQGGYLLSTLVTLRVTHKRIVHWHNKRQTRVNSLLSAWRERLLGSVVNKLPLSGSLITTTDADTPFHEVPLTVWWVLPQYSHTQGERIPKMVQ